LSVGERPVADLRYWRDCGADRYLLRFETSDPVLLRTLKPGQRSDSSGRLSLLRVLRRLGYEIGSGIMVGLPGQTFRSISRDIVLFTTLDLDMIGVGTYIPHPSTPLGRGVRGRIRISADQVPNTNLTTLKVVALARLACPEANIPATTALATIDLDGYEKGLMVGANVIMPNLTPLAYRRLYEIYPSPVRIGGGLPQRITGVLADVGRWPARGPGGRVRQPL
ncbi:MAG: [FeFe] hydrogenase H-cluster radical SAM maturase HydE, partial [bacterium]